MYANRYAAGPRFRPASLGAALAINGGVLAALLLAAPELVPRKPPVITEAFFYPDPPKPTPTPTPKTEHPRPQPTATVAVPDPPFPPPAGENDLTGSKASDDPVPPGPGTGTDLVIGPADPPPPPPLFVAARDDPRYRGRFQPPYPDFERDAGREDVVKLKVLIGIDGRVKQVVRLAGRDSFVRAATAHALAQWCFLPATRGGVPEESWRTMTVRFQLDG